MLIVLGEIPTQQDQRAVKDRHLPYQVCKKNFDHCTQSQVHSASRTEELEPLKNINEIKPTIFSYILYCILYLEHSIVVSFPESMGLIQLLFVM
jgi:hypothetical protein